MTTGGRVGGVVIGASAGGVEALSELLPAVPAGTAAAVFVVLHLPRERPSLLVEIFRGRCAAVVTEAQDKEPARSGTIYFAPPDYHLLVGSGPEIALSVDEPVNFSRPSIDVLFESAADVYGADLLGIILTGASQDGAAGLDAVQRAGGLAVVQQPEEAIAPFMPAAALKRRPDPIILSLAQIARLLRAMEPGGGAP